MMFTWCKIFIPFTDIHFFSPPNELKFVFSKHRKNYVPQFLKNMIEPFQILVHSYIDKTWKRMINFLLNDSNLRDYQSRSRTTLCHPVDLFGSSELFKKFYKVCSFYFNCGHWLKRQTFTAIQIKKRYYYVY